MFTTFKYQGLFKLLNNIVYPAYNIAAFGVMLLKKFNSQLSSIMFGESLKNTSYSLVSKVLCLTKSINPQIYSCPLFLHVDSFCRF